MKIPALLCVATLALAACAPAVLQPEAPGPAARQVGLVPAPARITDERILADRQTLEAVQARLRRLNEAGVAQNHYTLAKAQCWLDTARTQYAENDRSGYVEEALAQSQSLVQSLEADPQARAGFDTPLIARSTYLRDDLWRQLSALQALPMACNARTVACAEVRLVRAGHAEQQTGWRAALPHVQMVEDALRQSAQEAARCQPPAESAVVARSAAAPALAPAPAAPAVTAVTTATVADQPLQRERFTVLTDTVFRFGKSGPHDLSVEGRARLHDLVQSLQRYPVIRVLSITGHTDRLGSDDYNQQLSQRRAATIQDYLASAGIRAGRVESVGKGRREPVTSACGAQLPRPALIRCLAPDRRVSIEITGEGKP